LGVNRDYPICGTSVTKEEIAAWAKKHLAPGVLVVSDGLNCFPGVKEAGCGHESIVAHTDRGYDEHGVFKWVNVMIGNHCCPKQDKVEN
jgi:hypothetical protein